MTRRQIQYFLDAISTSKNKSYEKQAALHGMKLKTPLNSLKISKEERQEYDEQAQDAYKRLQERYKNQG